MQEYLKGLTALHSADMQAADSRALGRPVRRDPVTTEHPLVRTNPITGFNSLFFNPGFVTKIVGVPKIESDAIINLLTEVTATAPEAHARFQWGENDVSFWDNRSTVSGYQPISMRDGLEPDGGIESHGHVWLCSAPSSCGSGRSPGRTACPGSYRQVPRGRVCRFV